MEKQKESKYEMIKENVCGGHKKICWHTGIFELNLRYLDGNLTGIRRPTE